MGNLGYLADDFARVHRLAISGDLIGTAFIGLENFAIVWPWSNHCATVTEEFVAFKSDVIK